MQDGATHPPSRAGSEAGLDAVGAVQIADAVEIAALHQGAHPLKRLDRMGHQALAARLVDGAAAAFDHHHLQTRPGGVDRGGQAGRPAPRNQQVDHFKLSSAVFSTEIRVRSSSALSNENTAAVIHAPPASGRATPSATTAT